MAKASTDNDGTATTATTSSKGDLSCNKCIQKLREILNQPTSRPHQLLNALRTDTTSSSDAATLPMEDTPSGVKIAIPRIDLVAQKWTQLESSREQSATNNSSVQPTKDSSLFAPLRRTWQETTMATSATKTTDWLDIQCAECGSDGPEAGARAFVMGPQPLSVVLCTNRLQPSEISQVLVHEFMHVYDVRQLQLDLKDCETLAYSEVRAAREAECWTNPSTACLRQKAESATQNLFPSRGAACVQRVLEQARQDRRPFVSSISSATARGVESSQR